MADWRFADLVRLLHQDDEQIHGARAEGRDLCAVGQEPVPDGELERAEAQGVPVSIGHWTSLVQFNCHGRPLLDLALASPAGRTLTEGLPEKPAQMGLIREAHAEGDFTQWFCTGPHQVARSLKPSCHQVGMR